MGTNPRRADERKQKECRVYNHNAVPSKSQNQPPRDAPRFPNNSSINRLKMKIRNLTRALDHDKAIGRDIQIEMERAIAGYKKDLMYAEEEKRKKALIGRYHMVRFFERQKATRHLKKAKKRLETSQPDTTEHTEALQDVHVAEVDLNYTQYSPLNAKYEGIYPQEKTQSGKSVMKENGNGGEAQVALASRPAMWRIVESCMKQGTLEALRDGKMTRELPITSRPPPKDHARGPGGGVMLDASKSNSLKAARPNEMEVDDESDGGFFEE